MEARILIDDYMAGFPMEVQERLRAVLSTIRAANPKAEERWSYKMPGFHYQGKPLVYFAGYAEHIGVYALPDTHAEFIERLSSYKRGKGSVQFPHDCDLPLALIADMVVHRSKAIDAANQQA